MISQDASSACAFSEQIPSLDLYPGFPPTHSVRLVNPTLGPAEPFSTLRIRAGNALAGGTAKRGDGLSKTSNRMPKKCRAIVRQQAGAVKMKDFAVRSSPRGSVEIRGGNAWRLIHQGKHSSNAEGGWGWKKRNSCTATNNPAQAESLSGAPRREYCIQSYGVAIPPPTLDNGIMV